MKVPQWYVVQVSDTTMLPMAASLFGQEYFIASAPLDRLRSR